MYADVLYDPSTKKIISGRRDWKKNTLWGASESCKAQFIKELYGRNRKECSDDKVLNDKARLDSLQEDAPVELIVDLINNSCISSLKKFSFEWISKYFVRIASQKKLKEDSEVALLLLMNAINGRDYAKFYDLLEQDGNKLLKHLASEIDDASVDH